MSHSKVSLAVLAALYGSSVMGAESDSGPIQEVIVTAQRRAESAQDVPMTIQALTAETLAQLNSQTFDDFVRHLPNVTSMNMGAGQGEIIFRGLGTGFLGNAGSGTVGTFPNVAVYLDEQSGQLPGRNLDVYAADLERIEVLEGPQGTVFGAGAQAGVIRYITNKPKLNKLEVIANAGYASTAHGEASNAIDATINLPLIDDRLAARFVIYNDRRGGYIDNRRATFERAPTDKAIVSYFGGVVPPNSGPINNNAIAGEDINPVTYTGFRGQLLYQVNDDWKLTLSRSNQELDAQGVSWTEEYDGLGRPLPDLTVELFNNSFNKDEFENTALTVEGRLADLQLLYAGAYLVRDVDQVQDYTNYSRSLYAGYYQCDYPGYPFVGGNPTPGSEGFCYSPSSFWHNQQHDTHQSHEFRISTSDTNRLRGLFGLFWEDFVIHSQDDWSYTSNPHFNPIGPPSINPYTNPPTSHQPTSNNPNVRPTGTSYVNDSTRGYEQQAAFASVDFDIIPEVLTLTGGTRYYRITNFLKGWNAGSFGCQIGGPYNDGTPPDPCVSNLENGVVNAPFNNMDARHLRKTYSGFRSRASLTWHINADAMLYYTWSQGYRPGGFNRAPPQLRPSSPLFGVWEPPIAYRPDTLTNNEIGWKSNWFGNRLLLNGAVYQEDWHDVQLSLFNPTILGNLVFISNGPDYRVRGVELQFDWRATDALTFAGSTAWNDSENVKNLRLVDINGNEITGIANPFGELGQPLASAPRFAGNARLRYEMDLGEYSAFVQVGGRHQAYSYSSTNLLSTNLQGQPTRFKNPAFTTYDVSLGIGKGSWKTQVYAENVTDERAILSSSYSTSVKANVVNRPRTIGLRLSYEFGQ